MVYNFLNNIITGSLVLADITPYCFPYCNYSASLKKWDQRYWVLFFDNLFVGGLSVFKIDANHIDAAGKICQV